MSDDVGIPPVESYRELKERLHAELAGQTKQDVLKESGGVDLDNLPTSEHHWVQRGLKVSCEGAMHPHHSHFLIRR